MVTLFASRLAGAVIEKVTWAFGQKQCAQNIQKRQKSIASKLVYVSCGGERGSDLEGADALLRPLLLC